MTPISAHVEAMRPLILSVPMENVEGDPRNGGLVRWCLEVTRAVLDVDLPEAIQFVRRVPRR